LTRFVCLNPDRSGVARVYWIAGLLFTSMFTLTQNRWRIDDVLGLRLDQEEEFNGADLSIHRIGSTPERQSGW
jgi:hypothetical protein